MKTPINWKELSMERFAALGTADFVYIRPIEDEEGDTLYSICAADGEQLAVIDSLEDAVLTAQLNDFELVTVH